MVRDYIIQLKQAQKRICRQVLLSSIGVLVTDVLYTTMYTDTFFLLQLFHVLFSSGIIYLSVKYWKLELMLIEVNADVEMEKWTTK